MLMNYYRHVDRKKIQFDFLVHRQERAAFDDEIESLGGKIYRLQRLVPWSKSYLAALNAFFDEHPEFSPEPFVLDGLPRAEKGYLHLYPHEMRGEGHFVSLLQKPDYPGFRAKRFIATQRQSRPSDP